MNNLKFDWIRLNEVEFEIMKEESSKLYTFTIEEEFFWFQNEHTHFAYPLKLEHGNVILS